LYAFLQPIRSGYLVDKIVDNFLITFFVGSISGFIHAYICKKLKGVIGLYGRIPDGILNPESGREDDAMLGRMTHSLNTFIL